MTSAGNIDDPIPPGMMAEVLETIDDQLDALAALLHDARAGRADSAAALRSFMGIVHSLKGLVRAFGLGDLARLCHRLEDVLGRHQGFDKALLTLAGDIVNGLREIAQDGLLDNPRHIDALTRRLDRAA